MSSKAVPGGDAAVGVAFLGVVDVAAGLADPALQGLGWCSCAAPGCVSALQSTADSLTCAGEGQRDAAAGQRGGRAPGARERSYNPGPPVRPRQAATRDPAARRRADARGAARQAHAEGALHGRRVGVPGRRRRRATRATATRPTARPRCASCARRRPSSLRRPRRAGRSSRAGSPRRRCRSASTPTSSSPCCPRAGAARRRRGVRGSRLVHARGRARRPRARARSRSCSPRSSTSSSSATSPRSTSCSTYARGREVEPVEPRVVLEGEVARDPAAGRPGY